MHQRERKKMSYLLVYFIIYFLNPVTSKTIGTTEINPTTIEDNFDNNIINFEEDFSEKFNKKYGAVPWHSTDKFNKDYLKYTVVKYREDKKDNVKVEEENKKHNDTQVDKATKIVAETTPVIDYGVIPLELISTTENILVHILDSTTEPDLTVVPLSTSKKITQIEIKQTVTLPVSTESIDVTTEYPTSTENNDEIITVIENHETTTSKRKVNTEILVDSPKFIQNVPKVNQTKHLEITTELFIENYTIANNLDGITPATKATIDSSTTKIATEIILKNISSNVTILQSNVTKQIEDYKVNKTENVTKNAERSLEVNQTENLQITTERFIENSTNADNLNSKNPATIATIDSSTIKVATDIKYKNIISSNVTILQSNVKKQIEDNKLNKTGNVTGNVEKSLNNGTKLQEVLKTNSTTQIKKVHSEDFDISEFLEDFPVFTELDTEEEDVPEDYYDAKDIVPTTAPKTDALSVIFGLAGSVVESVVESVAERVVPKGLYDLFKRMQRQSEALEAERLRSREENGGIGQFTRGILKSLSSGLSKPLSQLMAGVKDIGSLDTDRGFVSSLASGVTSVASSVASVGDAFKDKVQAIYPGTVWCGDGHSAAARSSDLGLFFFTDTCCRQHDACKIFIKAGDTKYGLTNTGLFTRSHCSCDAKFRECLQRTNSLVSAQIGLTYFNVLGPQCFRKAHPIVKCVRRTRITGQKCEEYELDYTKPKMWQWFDNETF